MVRNPETQNPDRPKSRNSKSRNPKSRQGQNPDRVEIPTSQNPDRVKIPTGQVYSCIVDFVCSVWYVWLSFQFPYMHEKVEKLAVY